MGTTPQQHPQLAAPAKRKHRSRWPWIVLAVLVIGGVGAAVSKGSSTPSTTSAPAASEQSARTRPGP